jgi:glycerol-3-phosphate dehydrogenase
MTCVPAFSRDAALARLADAHFDVLVVGGGITGAGVALDAAARGLRTALVEARDFASGTSSKSSKLIHGGLRYLQQKEYRLVYEALAERQRLLENAPHLVRPLPFLIPLFGKDGVVNQTVAKAYSTALWLYDLTGGLRIGKRHHRLSLDEASRRFPSLRRDRLVAGFLYWDAQADDARLTLAVVRTAVLDYGAAAANYTPVTALLRDASGRIAGATVEPAGSSRPIDVRAAVVVNAGGVWADDVRELDEGAAAVGSLRPAKGIHLTVPASKLRVDVAAVLPVPKDRRSIFVVPWGDVVYLGTTDTDYQGPLENPQCTPDDVAYVLGAVNASVTEPLTVADVVGSWAGLRPLVADATSERTADLSRQHTVRTSASGLITVTGGKLTTYRRMAADTVDEVIRLLAAGTTGAGRPSRLSGHRHSPTRHLRVRGADGLDAVDADRLGLDESTTAHLVARYGGEARALAAMIAADRAWGRPLARGLPYLRAEALYAARYEMAQTVDDVLSRRTRARLRNRAASEAVAGEVATILATELGWDDAFADQQAREYQEAAEAERIAAGLPPGLPPAELARA